MSLQSRYSQDIHLQRKFEEEKCSKKWLDICCHKWEKCLCPFRNVSIRLFLGKVSFIWNRSQFDHLTLSAKKVKSICLHNLLLSETQNNLHWKRLQFICSYVSGCSTEKNNIEECMILTFPTGNLGAVFLSLK